jgi:hypothetical protein
MADQKEEQGKRLEELRQQRIAEEQKRKQEIERLKEEAQAKRVEQIKADLAKYQKIASSKYAKDMAGSAWEALVASYPEATEVVQGDVQAFIIATGCWETIGRDGRFIAYDKETVLDTRTNLMWAARDNGSNINWTKAKSYCENYRGGGYSDWRMPTQDELAGLYDSSKRYKATQHDYNLHLSELIQLSACCPWASETRGSRAARFHFGHGLREWLPQSSDFSRRALPVRSGK